MKLLVLFDRFARSVMALRKNSAMLFQINELLRILNPLSEPLSSLE